MSFENVTNNALVNPLECCQNNSSAKLKISQNCWCVSRILACFKNDFPKVRTYKCQHHFHEFSESISCQFLIRHEFALIQIFGKLSLQTF